MDQDGGDGLLEVGQVHVVAALAVGDVDQPLAQALEQVRLALRQGIEPLDQLARVAQRLKAGRGQWPQSRGLMRFGCVMPPKVRDLVSKLEKAEFRDRGGKGSHRNFVHPKVPKPITISGKPGDDAKQYLVRAVEKAIEDAKK